MRTNNFPAGSAVATGVGTGGRVVLKIGTSSLVTDGRLDPVKLDRLCDVIHSGLSGGLSPVLVASGAIALGRARHPVLRTGVPGARQVAAALGQAPLYSAIQAAFAERGRLTGQLLLTPPDLLDRDTEVRDTLDTMRALGVVPVVNENDALGVRNNDVLAALLAGFLGADLLLLLTDVAGLYDRDPLAAEDARHLGSVLALTPELEELAGGSTGDSGTGGMRTKLSACWIATLSGVRAVITDTADADVLVAAAAGRAVGTAFQPRRRTVGTPGIGTLWRAFRTPPVGALHCAVAGLAAVRLGEPIQRQHVIATHGRCGPGDVVHICDPAGRPVARGIAGAGPVVGADDYVQIVEDSHVGN